jgi:hypothetical protein
MRQPIQLRTIVGLTLFLVLLACDLLPVTPTPNGVATGVAGTKTAWAVATAVANTLIAEAPRATQTTPPTTKTTFTTPAPTAMPTTMTGATLIPTLPPMPFTATPVQIPPAPLPPSAVFYNLILRYSKNCLGSQAAEVTCSSSTRVWNLVPSASGDYFQLQLPSSNTCLSASSTLETDTFSLASCQASDAQLWRKRMSGGYFQLENKTLLANGPWPMCIDARQWNAPLMQWFCKPHGVDDQLDNQLFCQTTSNTADCAPPAGVYVTNIAQAPRPYSLDGKPNTFLVFFQVTFSNTTGAEQSYRWFVQTFGQNSGQTTDPKTLIPIPSGTTTVTVGPWNIGKTCTDYTAKVIWRREIDGLLFAFRDSAGSEASLSFPVHTDPGCP